VAREAGVARLDVPAPGVEVVRRGRYLFVLNPTDEPVAVRTGGVDLLADDLPGPGSAGTVTVAARDAAVIREEE
jgi:beta-galactosidase